MIARIEPIGISKEEIADLARVSELNIKILPQIAESGKTFSIWGPTKSLIMKGISNPIKEITPTIEVDAPTKIAAETDRENFKILGSTPSILISRSGRDKRFPFLPNMIKKDIPSMEKSNSDETPSQVASDRVPKFQKERERACGLFEIERIKLKRAMKIALIATPMRIRPAID